MRAHAGRSITKLLCKIAINVAPIVRLRLVDSHISTYLIRLLVLLPPLYFVRVIVQAENEKKKKKKEEKRGEKSDERGKKK